MANLVVKIAVIESESGWGSKIDDYMVCLSASDAEMFREEFNSKNNQTTVPDWYMQVEGEPIPLDLSDAQFSKLQAEKRVWLSILEKV